MQEAQRSTGGRATEPRGFLMRPAAGLPLWLDGAPGAEEAAVAKRLYHGGCGLTDRLRFRPVQWRAG